MTKQKVLLSMKFYELIKQYRNLSSEEMSCTLRGILDRKETWLLDELEKAVEEVYGKQ